MGKFHSKHGDCYIDVNTHVNPMLSSDSECSHQPLIMNDSDLPSKDFSELHIPLQVILPPVKESFTTTVLESHTMEKKDLQTDTDTTDNNISTTREQHTLQFEEFECGLSVQSSRSDRQEWSFTLYDFDGQGRVTKEDLAQLLKSLYDAVGSSISLPQEGTKSLKLQLTVSPDKTKLHVNSADQAVAQPDLNRKECNHDKEQKHSPKKDINSQLNNGSVGSCSHKKQPSLMAQSPISQVVVRNNLSKVHRRSHEPRLSATEHRQLADLVQYNMQLNHQKHHRLRSPKNDVSSMQATLHTPKHANHINPHVSSQENADRRNYYLDLAGIENPATTSILNTSLPEPIPDLHKASPRRKKDTKSHTKSRTERFGKKTVTGHVPKVPRKTEDDKISEDLLVEVNRVLSGSGEPSGVVQPSASSSPRRASANQSPHKDSSTQKRTPTRVRKHAKHVVTGGDAAMMSPLKHVTTVIVPPTPGRRHKNNSRAMQQVADWIKKEHLKHDQEPIVVQRHEHHHIHEHHHHHHYHHYHNNT